MKDNGGAQSDHASLVGEFSARSIQNGQFISGNHGPYDRRPSRARAPRSFRFISATRSNQVGEPGLRPGLSEDAPSLRSVTVALGGGDAVLSWASREALMQRLREISERSHIRSRFDPDGASPVALTPAQRASLLVILDDWPETMPQELLELRNALITDVRCRKSTAPAREFAGD